MVELLSQLPVIPQKYVLRIYPDPCLSVVCREVQPGEDINRLVSQLEFLCRRNKGLGLAAPQIGDLRRVILVRRSEFSPGVIMLNPEVIERSHDYTEGDERCLSLPGRKVRVLRPERVEFQFLNLRRQVVRLKYEQAAARVFFHELDHLDGKTIADYREVET